MIAVESFTATCHHQNVNLRDGRVKSRSQEPHCLKPILKPLQTISFLAFIAGLELLSRSAHLLPTQESSFFGLQASLTGYAISDLPSLPWGKDADFILEFGILGYLTFRLSSVGAHIDAPCRLRLIVEIEGYGWATFASKRLPTTALCEIPSSSRFAAIVREDGSLPAFIFEKPSLSPLTDYIVDYDALFSAIVYDYVLASGDLDTGHILWSTVVQCVKRRLTSLNPITYAFEAERSQGFKLIDCAKDLDKDAAEHGLLLYCLKRINMVAQKLGKEASYLEIAKKVTRLRRSSSNMAFLFQDQRLRSVTLQQLGLFSLRLSLPRLLAKLSSKRLTIPPLSSP